MVDTAIRSGMCALVAFFSVLFNGGFVSALRLVRVDSPGGVMLGDPVRLNCSFDLENDQLYSVKWYKGNREFYRYVPTEVPISRTYQQQGVYVDKKKSNMNTLVLYKTDVFSEDTYKCEVSAEAPSFQTIRAEKELKVYVLPKKGPEIVGARPQYDIGDIVNVTCHAGLSRPAGRVELFINGEHPAEEDNVTYSVEYHHGLMKSSLGLIFQVERHHFDKNGVMNLKCTVTVSESYSLSSEKIVVATDMKTYEKELPDDGPVIYGGQTHYHVGDIMNVTCTYTHQGKPVALSWLLNDEEVRQDYLVHYQPEKMDKGMYHTALGLRFTVRPRHFRHELLQLKCIAEVEGPRRPHVVHHSGVSGSKHPNDHQGYGFKGSQTGHKPRGAHNGHHQITPPLSIHGQNNLSQYSAGHAAQLSSSPYNGLLTLALITPAIGHLLIGLIHCHE